MAAKPYDYYRVVLSGNTIGDQSWSTGTAVQAAETAPTAAMLNTWANSIANSVSTMWGVINQFIGTDTLLHTVKIYYYPSGSAVATVVGMHQFGTALAGAATTNEHPLQVSLVASLTTGLAGAHNRGRMYLPINAMALTNRLMSAGNVQTIGTAFTDYLTNLNATTLNGEAVHVVIAGSAAAPTVTSVTMDNKPDIQRRRVDKIQADFAWVQAV